MSGTSSSRLPPSLPLSPHPPPHSCLSDTVMRNSGHTARTPGQVRFRVLFRTFSSQNSLRKVLFLRSMVSFPLVASVCTTRTPPHTHLGFLSHTRVSTHTPHRRPLSVPHTQPSLWSFSPREGTAAENEDLQQFPSCLGIRRPAELSCAGVAWGSPGAETP